MGASLDRRPSSRTDYRHNRGLRKRNNIANIHPPNYSRNRRHGESATRRLFKRSVRLPDRRHRASRRNPASNKGSKDQDFASDHNHLVNSSHKESLPAIQPPTVFASHTPRGIIF